MENFRAKYFYLGQAFKQCYECSNLVLVSAIILPEGAEAIDQIALDEMSDEEYEKGFRPFCNSDCISILSYVDFISAQALIEIKKYSSNYSLGYSKTLHSSYLMSKCENCLSNQGDYYTIEDFNSPFSPGKIKDFNKISFIKILTPIQVHAKSSSSGYIPLEYFLGNEKFPLVSYFWNHYK